MLKVSCILGPTAVGKTDLSISLAQHFNTEIISCDSRQFFQEMSIGTAKPSEGELAKIKARQAPRHLQKSAEYAWTNRWWALVGIGVQRGIAETLLCDNAVDLLPCQAYDNAIPLADVLEF